MTHFENDSHLPRWAYALLSFLAGVLGLAASYVTIRFFIVSINLTEADDGVRDLLALAAVLFVAAELVAVFLVGVLPARRLRSLRWKLAASAALLLTFEAATIYGSQMSIARASEARIGASEARVGNLRATIESQRRTAAALVAAGERSASSVIASSRADASASLRRAAELEAEAGRLAAELATLEAAQVPSASAVYGESGLVALSIARALLVSSLGLVMLGAAGALARAARAAVPAATPAAATPAPGVLAVQSLPAAAQRWRTAGVALASIPVAAFAVPVPAPVAAVATPAAATPATPATPPAAATVVEHTQQETGRIDRVRAAILAGELKPAVRSVQAFERCGTAVARRCLSELSAAGVIVDIGRGRGYRLALA